MQTELSDFAQCINYSLEIVKYIFDYLTTSYTAGEEIGERDLSVVSFVDEGNKGTIVNYQVHVPVTVLADNKMLKKKQNLFVILVE